MINRRFMIVPPALPRGGYAEKLKTRAMEFPYLLLEVANMSTAFPWNDPYHGNASSL
jgi:hypothetical protein